MDFAIEQMPAQTILFMRRTGAYGAANMQLMESLKKWANDKGLFENSIIYGIAQDPPNTPPEQCRYDVCLVIPTDYPADSSVQKGEIPSGKYAVFTIPHTTGAVQEFWNSVIRVLEEKGLNYNMQKTILERYKFQVVADGKCEFCVPIV